MVGECFHIEAKFSMASITEGEKFSVLGDQSRVVFPATDPHHGVVARNRGDFERLGTFQNASA